MTTVTISNPSATQDQKRHDCDMTDMTDMTQMSTELISAAKVRGHQVSRLAAGTLGSLPNGTRTSAQACTTAVPRPIYANQI